MWLKYNGRGFLSHLGKGSLPSILVPSSSCTLILYHLLVSFLWYAEFSNSTLLLMEIIFIYTILKCMIRIWNLEEIKGVRYINPFIDYIMIIYSRFKPFLFTQQDIFQELSNLKRALQYEIDIFLKYSKCLPLWQSRVDTLRLI